MRGGSKTGLPGDPSLLILALPNISFIDRLLRPSNNADVNASKEYPPLCVRAASHNLALFVFKKLLRVLVVGFWGGCIHVNCIGPKALYIDIMIMQNGSVKTEVVKDLFRRV